ncbi:DUF5677 domain-containing protein [Streptomyces mirabilis]|uniref:DUF5677 domain-containing protein n=1 Tax=Streptomyces mirabilis TaxID=68239 RepID=UPI0036DEA985
MNIDDSLFLDEVTRRANSRMMSIKKEVGFLTEEVRVESLDSAFNEAVDDAEEIAPDFLAEFRARIIERRKERALHEERVRRTNLKRWDAGFREFNELLVIADAFLREMGEVVFDWYSEHEEPKEVRLLGTDGIGGGGLKAFLFISMHARACAISAEIHLLMERGYPDGVNSRLRSLYETVVMMCALVHAEAAADTEVTERYCAWSAVEAKKEGSALAGLPGGVEVADEDIPEFEQRAKDRWGAAFFKQHGWALPLFPGRSGGVTFSDIDRLVGIQDMRPLYLTGNHSIHAGPTSMMRRVDFTQAGDFFISGAEAVSPEEIGAAMTNTIYLLTHSALTAHYTISALTGSFNIRFLANPLLKAAKSAVDMFEVR